AITATTPARAQQRDFSDNKNFEILKNIEILTTIYQLVEQNYVDEVQPGTIIKTGIDAMLRSLDPYTVYIPEANIEDYRMLTLGHYGGIGSTVHYRNGNVYISDPYKGFPADEAGLKPGDKIISINGESTKGRNVEDVSALLKGQAGTTLEMEIERKDVEKPISVKIVRREIEINNVTYSGMLNKHIGYIRLDGFTQSATDEVKKHFDKLKAEGMNALVFDLRYNGGGLMNEAVKIVNMFYQQGVPVVSTKGKVADKNATFYTTTEPIDTKIPIVFLTSRMTASASEIVSGALQDYDRAVVVGERTFGKGLVQNILPLVYNAQLKITISKYYIPSGRCVQAVDYFHRDSEGKANKIPDSLRTAYKTKGGRTVYDGDGIEPDVEIEAGIFSDVLQSVASKYIIFDFATDYRAKHKEIGKVEDFQVSDELYNEFKIYAENTGYSYKLPEERSVEELETVAKETGVYNDISTELENLRNKIIDTKKGDLDKNKTEIKRFLRDEIIARYYYQEGRAQSELSGDKTVSKAIEILENKQEYNKILKP
ncbi:MAG: S41 family peptidase, partial [Bacteroidales bacterium]|nr:S41 family peptidase [Bacteroidales bacterium]